MNTGDLLTLPEERRIVTVLFADVTGFTAMSEPMDMEDVRDLIDACWQRLDATIVQYGGRIDKHIGDAVMAVWGAPHAGEDDAANAIRAGLALQRELAEFNRGRPGGAELLIRVGINTGPALAGTVGSLGEYTVIGDTVNFASRVQALAEPGTVVIGPQTFEEVRGLFDLQPLAPVAVKGRTGPLIAFRVGGEKAHPSRVRYRGSPGLDLRLVGREAELKSLMSAYARATARRRPTLALLVGEAGLGKSRLLMEFSKTIEMRPERPLLLSARALAQTAHVPFGLWKAVWSNWLSIDDGDPPRASGDKFVKGILELWGSTLGPVPGVEVAHAIGGLIGVEFPNSPYLAPRDGQPWRARDRAFELTAQLFARAGRRAPIILLLDDLHWADDGTLELIEHLLMAAEDMPLLMLGGARPAAVERTANWRAREGVEIIPLTPLPAKPQMVKDIFAPAESLPESWLALLAVRSGGNPYFLEELIRAMIRQGAILVRPDGWRAANDGPLETALPDSLQSLLQARLDALPADVKAVAQAAAVVGRVFWAGAILAILRTSTGTGLLTASLDETSWRPLIDSALRTLQQNELAFERVGSGTDGDREFIFKHHLLRDVAYEMLPKKYRRRYHAAAATWLAGHGSHPALIAEHLEQAGEYARAAVYYRQAAEDAAARGATAEAAALTERWQAVERQMERIGSGPLR